MVWWQELLIVASSMAFGILIGVIGLRIAIRIWPTFFSRKRRISVSNNAQVQKELVVDTPPLVKLNKEDTLNAPKSAEELPAHEVMMPFQEKIQPVEGQAESIRKHKKTIEQTKVGTERSNREKNIQAVGDSNNKILKDVGVAENTNQASALDKKWQALALLELQTNLKIASAPWDGTPLPFQTEVWDRDINQFDTMGKELRLNLGEAYLDMHVANQIVWLFTSSGSINNALAAHYRQLCAKVADRLTLLLQ